MNHQPRKRFGQHFLSDNSILMSMRQAVAPNARDHLVEIGPGLGVLTKQLVDHVAHYDAIEIDRDLIPILQNMFGSHQHFVLHAMDVLQVDWAQLANGHPIRVVGNLPYNISTPLLFHLFSSLSVIDDMYFLLQKEVGDRLAASVGAHNYGRLSVMAQYYCDIELLFDVGPNAFTPPPKVNSVFLRLIPKPAASRCVTDLSLFEKIVAAAFNQRRKTLRNSLQQVVPITLLESLDIDPQKRAQNVSVEDYVRLANALARDIL